MPNLKDITDIPNQKEIKELYRELTKPEENTTKNQPTRTKTNLELRSREYLTVDEVNQLRKAVRKNSQFLDRDEAIILVGFRHGLRLKELADLKWDQINFKDNLMHVKRAKNGLASTHPIKPDELRLLKKLSKDPKRQKHVFISRNNLPISEKTLNTIIKKAGKDAGLDFPIHPHMLRHGCGYYLANKGIDTRAIQLYMGHRNIQSTVIYTQLDATRFDNFWED